MRFAVDTGGTFTDLVVADAEGGLGFYKTPTTAKNRVQGVLTSFRLAADDLDLSLSELLGRGELLVHGTTTATNAIVTGETAKTAFLTTAGHPDVLVFREGGRMGAPMFDYLIPYPKPYVPRALTFEVTERIGADGEVVVPLDVESVRAVIERLGELEVQAVAVCFLWSIVNNTHERRVGELIDEALPGVHVTLSHALNPTLREYRRASSACIDASLKPLMDRYLRGLDIRLRECGYRGRVLVVTSQGTVREAGELASAPIHTVKSGPAMSPVAGRHYAQTDFGAHTAIVVDAGGTTSDVSLIRRGQISETRETWLGPPFLGHMTGFPSIDVRSVGAGGQWHSLKGKRHSLKDAFPDRGVFRARRMGWLVMPTLRPSPAFPVSTCRSACASAAGRSGSGASSAGTRRWRRRYGRGFRRASPHGAGTGPRDGARRSAGCS